MDSVSWSITTTLSSASAANVRCWGCRDPRSITAPHLCLIDPADHCQDSCSVPGGSLQRTPPDGGLRGARRDPDQLQSCTLSHAAYKLTGLLPKATHDGSRRPISANPHSLDPRLVTTVDQAWATEFSFIPLLKGFLYLVAIVDLLSRTVLSWKLSNSLQAEFFLDALEMALGGGRRPEIFHSHQGCQFTSGDFVARLQGEEIKIS